MTQIKLKRNFLPRTIGDTVAFLFLILILPFCYWFEVFIVLPTKQSYGSFWYMFYLVWFTFLFISIVSNFTYVVLMDCSIRGEIMPSTVTPFWKFCDVCESVTPPRSYHCEVCKTCILKRDHHCYFTGCCIGHQNQRYFLIFLLYMSVATIQVVYFNAMFIFQNESLNIWTLIRFVFPVAVFMLGVDVSLEHCYFVIFVINVLGMLASVMLLIYHASTMLRGAVMYEKSHNMYDYDLGSVANIKQVFGYRWYLTWISPFIRSELPSDGVNWEFVKLEANKSK